MRAVVRRASGAPSDIEQHDGNVAVPLQRRACLVLGAGMKKGYRPAVNARPREGEHRRTMDLFVMVDHHDSPCRESARLPPAGLQSGRADAGAWPRI